MVETPVVLISFNRPEPTRRTLARIREAAPSELFLVCDGARVGHPTDAQRVEEVRRVLEDVDWPCKVHRLYDEHNRGCEGTVESRLDEIFETVPAAIILEDDCVPDLTFFRFCDELLERYADDDRVMQIAGSSYGAVPESFHGDSYAFAAFSSVWGWATWARAWQTHRALFPRMHPEHRPPGSPGTPPYRPVPPTFPRDAVLTGGGRRYFTDVANSFDNLEFSWDSHWWASIVATGGVAITPALNHVENIGFGEDATYTLSNREMPRAVQIEFPLKHPEAVRVNPEVERELERVLVRSAGRLARNVRKRLPRGPLTDAARRIATGPAAVRAMRAVSETKARLRERRRRA